MDTDSPKELKATSFVSYRPYLSWAERVFIAAIVAVVCWFYAWTALPPQHSPRITSVPSDYYNSLTVGFLSGHTYLATPADPALAKMKNPWDPLERGGHGLHDASYFKGRYYLYFGPTPILLLFAPFHLVTGKFISDASASVVFGSAAFICSLFLLLEVKKRYLRSPSLVLSLSIAIALGLCTMLPDLLRRASVWEVPITCAYFCASLAMLCLYYAFHSKRGNGWLALASLLLGLAVASRPVYLFGCAALFIPIIYKFGKLGGLRAGWKSRAWWRTFCSAVGPVFAVGVGIGLYNFARFEKFTEFGQIYQMAGAEVSKLTLFNWRFPLYGLRIYLLEPAIYSPYFAFFNVILPPPGPPGHLGVEDPYGVLPNIPYVLLSLGLVVGFWKRKTYRALSGFILSVSVLVILTLLTVSSFGGLTNRYMVDFVPGMIVLATVGALLVYSHFAANVGFRLLTVIVVVILVIYSAAFNILVSLQHNDQLQAEQPELYKRIAHRANYISYAWDRLTGVKYGPLEMKVIFQNAPAGHTECLLATGASFRADYIYLYYQGNDQVAFGFEHTSRGGPLGKPIHITPGRAQTVKIDMGSLYPPAGHPFYDHLPTGQGGLLRHLLKVTVDGEVALEGIKDFYDASAHQPSFGTSANRPGFKSDFSGKIVSWKRRPKEMPRAAPVQYGPMRITLKFPPFREERNEPILCSGETGSGDLVFAHYMDDHTMQFGHDNWGGGGRWGEPFTVDYSTEHVVEIDYGALYPPESSPQWSGPVNRAKMIVRIDGKVAIDVPAPYHPSSPDDVVLGNNSILASSCYPVFTGTILKYERVPPAP